MHSIGGVGGVLTARLARQGQVELFGAICGEVEGRQRLGVQDRPSCFYLVPHQPSAQTLAHDRCMSQLIRGHCWQLHWGYSVEQPGLADIGSLSAPALMHTHDAVARRARSQAVILQSCPGADFP